MFSASLSVAGYSWWHFTSLFIVTEVECAAGYAHDSTLNFPSEKAFFKLTSANLIVRYSVPALEHSVPAIELKVKLTLWIVRCNWMRNKITTAKIVAVLCVVFLFSFFSVPFAKADWSMFHADSSHSGVGSGPSVLTFTKLWSYTTGGLVESSPAVVNGVVYVGSYDHHVYALKC